MKFHLIGYKENALDDETLELRFTYNINNETGPLGIYQTVKTTEPVQIMKTFIRALYSLYKLETFYVYYKNYKFTYKDNNIFEYQMY